MSGGAKLTAQQKSKLVNLRRNHRVLQLKNVNYFGNLTKLKKEYEKLKPVLKLIDDTFFEEVTCVSYSPASEELRAVVVVKQTFGYKGGPCQPGSKEYVRFYIDYKGDGQWEDLGAVNFDVHDLPLAGPLHYGVCLHLEPKHTSACFKTPVLPIVLAVLSWDDVPPANSPAWEPVWGNKVVANVQIAPSLPFIGPVLKDPKDLLLKKQEDLVKIWETMKSPPLVLDAGSALAYGPEAEASRVFYQAFEDAVGEQTMAALEEFIDGLEEQGIDIDELADALAGLKFNTYYEELVCLGLNRDTSVLHAGILVKEPIVYLGNLCQKGSLEYVAFYADFGQGWQYMGTTSVRVHDIPHMPDDGLMYHASLPISLTSYQQAWCATGSAKVRAVLSWAVPPTPYDPEYQSQWGNRRECLVEVRPLPPGVVPGVTVPIIQTLGGMDVDLIAGGYATGHSPTSGITANQSPFGGAIKLTGFVTNGPDWSSSGSKLKYRIMVKEPSTQAFVPRMQGVRIYVTRYSTGEPVSEFVDLLPDAEGWMDYCEDPVPPDVTRIAENLLGWFPTSTVGMHEVYVEIKDPATGALTQSQGVAFMVDMTAPEVGIYITSGAGECGLFHKGDIIKGTFSYKERHYQSMSLNLSPAGPAQGTVPTIDYKTSPPPNGMYYGDGVLCADISGTWTLDTTNMKPCGYVICIDGYDRTIVDSRYVGRRAQICLGFCVQKREE